MGAQHPPGSLREHFQHRIAEILQPSLQNIGVFFST